MKDKAGGGSPDRPGTPARPADNPVLDVRRTVISPYVTLCARLVRLEGKAEPEVFHSLDQADYVSVLAQTTDGRIVLVRQFRPAVEAETLELPGGLLGAGEDPAICAARELEEETGYRATAPLVLLGRILPDVGRLDNALWAYYAEGVESAPSWSPEPGVEPALFDKAEFLRTVAAGGLANGPHLGMLALAHAQGRFW